MKLLDTAEIKDLQSLITNGNILNIKVKFYQRPYRWTAKKVTDLFEDYRDNRESALMNGDNSKEYFIGAVVFVDERVQEEKDSGKIWKYQVVDGQQRFTTLFLFNYIKYILLVKKSMKLQEEISPEISMQVWRLWRLAIKVLLEKII